MNGSPVVRTLWAWATTECVHDPMCATDWDDRYMPLAPAAAIAEWLRREPCALCCGRGCVVVESVEVYDDDDQVVDQWPE